MKIFARLRRACHDGITDFLWRHSWLIGGAQIWDLAELPKTRGGTDGRGGQLKWYLLIKHSSREPISPSTTFFFRPPPFLQLLRSTFLYFGIHAAITAVGDSLCQYFFCPTFRLLKLDFFDELQRILILYSIFDNYSRKNENPKMHFKYNRNLCNPSVNCWNTSLTTNLGSDKNLEGPGMKLIA